MERRDELGRDQGWAGGEELKMLCLPLQLCFSDSGIGCGCISRCRYIEFENLGYVDMDLNWDGVRGIRLNGICLIYIYILYFWNLC